MTFKTVLEGDLSIFFNVDEFATEIIYAGANIVAIIDESASPQYFPRGESRNATVYIREEQVQSPQMHDILQFNGLAWVVDNIQKSESIFILNVHTSEAMGIR